MTKATKLRGFNFRRAPAKTAKSASENSSSHVLSSQQTINESNGSGAKLQGFIGIIAITLGNIAAIVTHVDEIGKFISKLLGTEWAYRFHALIVFGAYASFMVGYGSLTYWLYWNFVAHRTRWIKAGFSAAALIAVGTVLVGSYFMFRPDDYAPLLLRQAGSYTQTILSQQATGGDDDGGFRFSQGGISNDVQVWTTAQCLVALLQQDVTLLKDAGPAFRRAFDYIERSRSSDGWAYMKNFDWGVTEISGWVALAYIYSAKPDAAAIIWKPEELPTIMTRIRSTLSLLLDRQHDDGGWAPIAKTSNLRHERTYSTIVAIWALAAAEQNGDISNGHDVEYRAALTSGAKWLLQSYGTNTEGFAGWWPNPSAHNPVGSYPGLTAQTLFALSEAKIAHPIIGADPRFKEAIQNFIQLSLDGSDHFESLTERKIQNNEKAHDSDRYLEGRSETAEQSTFLWYPWTIALGVNLNGDDLILNYQQERLRSLVLKLLDRVDEEDSFVRHDEVIYPMAEALYSQGLYLSRNGLMVKTK
jgi:hypothetical protein